MSPTTCEGGTVNAVLGGTVGLNKTTAGTATINAPIYTGTTTVSAGTLAFSGALPGGNYVIAGGTLDINALSQTIGTFRISGGTVNGSGTLTSSSDFNVQSGTVNAALAGGAFADQDRPGRVRPQRPAYTGSTNVQAGTLRFSGSLPGGNYVISGGTLDIGALSSAIGTLQISGGAVSGSGTLTSSTSFNVQSGAVNVVLAGSASLTKTGPDVFVVNNPAYTGSTTVSGGTLTFSGNLPDGAYAVSGGTLDIGAFSKSIGAFQITSGAVIGSGTLTSSGTYAVAGGQVNVVLTGSNGLTKSNKAQAILNGANTYSGATTITSGVLRATIGTLDAPVGGINYNSFLRLDGGIYQSASASTFNRSLGASGSAFQWTANGGGFSASEGGLTVNIGDGAALTWGNNVGSEIVGPLRLSSLWAASPTTFQNAIDLNGGERVVSVDDSPSSTLDCGIISGVLSGTGSLTKAGYGLLVLTANNTYSGVTTVSLGTLQLGAGSASGDVGSSSGIVINSGCILSVNRSEHPCLRQPDQRRRRADNAGRGHVDPLGRQLLLRQRHGQQRHAQR